MVDPEEVREEVFFQLAQVLLVVLELRAKVMKVGKVSFLLAILSVRLPLVVVVVQERKAHQALQGKVATAELDWRQVFLVQVLPMREAAVVVVTALPLLAQAALVAVEMGLKALKRITALPAPSTQEAAAVETKLAVPASSSSAISPHSNGTFRKAKRKKYRPRGDRRK
jgi:hypothetical protein